MTTSTITETNGHEPEVVDIVCADGQRLRGHFFRRSSGAEWTGLPVLISPATGVKQTFYLRFARWLAAQGYEVLVFDYRGIGMSLQGPLADCRATLAQWGQLDQVAAVDWLLARTGSERLNLIGHSAGGQMIGLLHNHHRIARLVGVSASSGWFGGMRLGFALKARLGLLGIVPLGIRLTGYAPTAFIGLGENLPAEVGRQWGQWCEAGGYATNAVSHRPAEDFHSEVRTPVALLYAADDEIATAATVGDLVRTLPHAPCVVSCVRAGDLGLPGLGHIDWFRSSHSAVWPVILGAMTG